MNILGAAAAFVLVIGAIVMGGPAMDFFDIPSLAMVFGITWSLMTFKYGKKAFTFWWLAESERSQIASWSGRTCMHVGVVSAIIGYIQIGNSLKDLSSIGPALSIAKMTIFYSYLCYLFLFSPFSTSKEVSIHA